MNYSQTFYGDIPSTNMIVKQAIVDGAPEGLVACAKSQSEGYGNFKRSWISPVGGLYFSMLLRPERPMEEWPQVSFLMALSVRKVLAGLFDYAQANNAMESTCSISAQNICFKWPNDVLVDPGNVDNPQFRFQKITGISLELYHEALCLGVGINVFSPTNQQNVEGKNKPLYFADLLTCAGEKDDVVFPGVAQQTVSKQVAGDVLSTTQEDVLKQLLDDVLQEFNNRYATWSKNGFSAYATEYNNLLCLVGKEVTLVDSLDKKIVSGTVRGIDDQGKLLLCEESGAVTAFNSGEISVQIH